MTEVLIGRGKTAKVYKIIKNPYSLVRKEFSPIPHVKLWNWFFYHSPHPLATDAGHKYAYWKRKLAHRLCKCSDSTVHITDAIQPSLKGFVLRYVEGHLPKRDEKRIVYTTVKKLEDFFNSIGMPTWSFSSRNPFSGSNFILHDDDIYIIDYEQSVPIPDSKGNIGYDIIYFDDVHKFIADNRQQILDKLGDEETGRLAEAFELTREYWAKLDLRPKTITKVVNIGKKAKGDRRAG